MPTEVPPLGDAQRISAQVAGSDIGTDPFVAAVRATRMPMIITDPRLPDNPVVFANDAFCRLSGYSRGEIIGRNCRFLQGPNTDPATVSKIREAVEAERGVEVDILNQRKDGEPFWNRLLMAPVRDESGNVAYFFASQVDVTIERERLSNLENSNAALVTELADRLREQKANEEDLRFTLEAGKFGAWSLDLLSNELVTSTHCRLNFGRSASDPFSYEDLKNAVHPEDRDRMQGAVAESIASGNDYDIEYRIIAPNGEIRWIAIRARPSYSSEGVPLRMAGLSIDITERTRLERMRLGLSQLSDAFRELEDSAGISYTAGRILGEVLGVDRAGYGNVDPVAETITIERDWNAPGVTSLAGTLNFRDYGSYIDDLVRGETVSFANAEKDPRTASTAAALKSITAQAVVNMPVVEQGKIVALFYLNHGQPREWRQDELDFLRDVASRTRIAVERRRAELALQALNETLELRVAERTGQLMQTEEALRQAQKMEAVGQLTGGLSHDFNNLLAGITGSLELIKRHVAAGRYDSVERFVTVGLGAAQRAAALTHRLLAFSRRQTLAPKVLATNRLVADMEDLLRRTIGPQIDLDVVTGMALWPIKADASQLENALLNLCINARDAMPDGGKLTVETANRRVDEQTAKNMEITPGQYVSLCVSDTGVGMPPEVVARAFDPFFTTKPIGVGTGLGLSMIYGFARQSGGHVRIYSEVGKGTMVCIYLPRYLGVEVDAPREEVAEPSGDRGDGQVVLVVDDEASVRLFIREVLISSGYRVLEAADGIEALRVLESGQHLDLLVTDVGLPGGMNGRQVADAARSTRPDLQILFITGYAENAVLSHGHLEPGMHVMTKPFELQVFMRRVESLLSSKQ